VWIVDGMRDDEEGGMIDSINREGRRFRGARLEKRGDGRGSLQFLTKTTFFIQAVCNQDT